MHSPDEKGLSLDYLQAKLAVIVDEWRDMPTPTEEQVARWANLVTDLNIRIAAMEASLAQK